MQILSSCSCSAHCPGRVNDFALAALFYEIWRAPRTKRSFWKVVLWNLEGASHETIILEAFSAKIGGSIARNAGGSLFCEIWKAPRTKRSFWKLFLWRKPRTKRSFWKLFFLKFGGSLARKDHFGSFFSEIWRKLETFFCETLPKPRAKGSLFGSFFFEIWRKPRTKRSFWKLLLWKLSEAPRETLILQASSVKFGRSFASGVCAVVFLCLCGGVFVVAFVWWCFCGGVFVFAWWCGVFVVVFVWWCFCGGVFVFAWWCGGVFVVVFFVFVMVFLWWCGFGSFCCGVFVVTWFW